MDVFTGLTLLASILGVVSAIWKGGTWLVNKKRLGSCRLLVAVCGRADVRPGNYRKVRRGLKRLRYALYADNLKRYFASPEGQNMWYYVYFSPRLVNRDAVPLMNCRVSVTIPEPRTLRFEPVVDSQDLQLTPSHLDWFCSGAVPPGGDLFVEVGGVHSSAVPIRLVILKDSTPRRVLKLEVRASFEEKGTADCRVRGDVLLELDWEERVAWILVPVSHLGKAVLPTKELRLNRYYLVNLPPDEREKRAVLARLDTLGPPQTASARPNELGHYHLSPDGSKMIIQGSFGMEDLKTLRSLGATYLGAYLCDGMAEDSVYDELQRPEWNPPEATD